MEVAYTLKRLVFYATFLGSAIVTEPKMVLILNAPVEPFLQNLFKIGGSQKSFTGKLLQVY